MKNKRPMMIAVPLVFQALAQPQISAPGHPLCILELSGVAASIRQQDGTAGGSYKGTDRSKASRRMPTTKYRPWTSLNSVGFTSKVHLYDVRNFGARLDGHTDDTSAIQRAVNAASRSVADTCGTTDVAPAQSCSATVMLSGVAAIRSIALPSHIVLAGEAWQHDGFVQIAGSSGPMVSAASTNTVQIAIHDLFFNGNASNQTRENDCISLDNTAVGGLYQIDRNDVIYNVYASHCARDSFHFGGTSNASMIYNIWSRYAGRNGLYNESYDLDVHGFDVGKSGSEGIYNTGANSRFSDGKVWYSGQVTRISAGVYSAADRVFVSHVEAQDNWGPGFHVTGDGNLFSPIQGDGNNKGSLENPSLHAAGIYMNGLTHSLVDGVFSSHSEGSQKGEASTQAYGVDWTGPNNSNNTLILRTGANTLGNMNGMPDGSTCANVDGISYGCAAPASDAKAEVTTSASSAEPESRPWPRGGLVRSQDTYLGGVLKLGAGGSSYTFREKHLDTPICVATDNTAPMAVAIAVTISGFTITGKDGDLVSYVCVARK